MSLDTYSIRFGIKTARRGQHRSDERLVGIPTWPVRAWAKEYRAFHFISSASTHLAGKCLYFSSYELRYNLHVYQSSTKEGHQGPTFLADMDTHPIQVRAFSCSSLLPSLMTDEDADIEVITSPRKVAKIRQLSTHQAERRRQLAKLSSTKNASRPRLRASVKARVVLRRLPGQMQSLLAFAESLKSEGKCLTISILFSYV